MPQRAQIVVDTSRAFLARVDKRELGALAVILVLAAYLRIWNLDNLFMIVHDYDEGAWSLASRFMSEGLLPYRDFILAHPPAYHVLLAGVFKVFGYSFFYGRHLAVVISLAAVILSYLVGRRFYGRGAGLALAALVAVSPDLVYYGRRSVQEPLGLLMLLGALYVAAGGLQTGGRRRVFAVGVFLGLAVATKYTLAPAAIGVAVALALVAGTQAWRQLGRVCAWGFWFTYFCLALVFYSFVAALKWAVGLPVPLPFVDPLYATPGHMAVALLVFVCPVAAAVLVTRTGGAIGAWLRSAATKDALRILAWAAAGGAVGFFAVSLPFIIAAPGEFVQQTFLMHLGRPGSAFLSAVEMFRILAFDMSFLRYAVMPMVVAIPLVVFLLRRRRLGPEDAFVALALAVSFLFCQAWQPLPRYYVSTLLFVLVGLASVAPRQELTALAEWGKGALGIVAVIVFFFSISLVLLTNYTGYDVTWMTSSAGQREANEETVQLLESLDAKLVYSTSPSTVALSSRLSSSRFYDTFAMLWLEKKPPEEIVDNLIEEGVDYAVVDSWTRFWMPPMRGDVEGLVAEIRDSGRLVALVQPESRAATEVYALGTKGEAVFNGDFEHWSPATKQGERVPLGWQSVRVAGSDDEVLIRQATVAGQDCLGLSVCEGGVGVTLSTSHAGVVQQLDFPRRPLSMTVYPSMGTMSVGANPWGPSIHVLDGKGNDLTLGFSDTITSPTFSPCEECGFSLLMLPVELGKWNEIEADIASFWVRSGWPVPEEVSLLAVVSATNEDPGCYSLFVSNLGFEED